MNDKLRRIRRQQASLAERLGRSPSLEELASALGLKADLVRIALESQPAPLSLDVRVGQAQDTELAELLEDPHATPEQWLVRQQLHEALEQQLQGLEGREALVLRQRFGLADDTPRTLSEIGQNLQLSRERVRQIESRALLKLRQSQPCHQMHDYLAGLD
jgi:RNA polymerase nonessential primary-like sigma factor